MARKKVLFPSTSLGMLLDDDKTVVRIYFVRLLRAFEQANKVKWILKNGVYSLCIDHLLVIGSKNKLITA